MKNKINSQFGLNKIFKSQFVDINKDLNKLAEETVPHLTSVVSTMNSELGELHHDTAKQAQDIAEISAKLTNILNSLPQDNADPPSILPSDNEDDEASQESMIDTKQSSSKNKNPFTFSPLLPQ